MTKRVSLAELGRKFPRGRGGGYVGNKKLHLSIHLSLSLDERNMATIKSQTI